VLVVAEEAGDATALARELERAGHEPCGASDGAHVAARVRSTRAEALLVAAPGSTSALRLLLLRAREAAEAPLPAVLLLDGGSVWLRTALPQDLAPATALPAGEAGAARLAGALAALVAGDPGPEQVSIGGVAFERAGHRLAGPGGCSSLTPSEAAVLSLFVAAPGAFTSTAELARALWGQVLTDRHARGAIRSHVHTLRGKLAAAGFAGVVESRAGVGYRLVEGPLPR